MKKELVFSKVISICLLMILSLFRFNCWSQQYFSLTAPNSQNVLFYNSSRVGLWPGSSATLPNAVFHIKSIESFGTPLFLSQVYKASLLDAQVSILGVDANGYSYGIYQSESIENPLVNYFQSDVIIGKGRISSGRGVNVQSFSFYPTTTQFQFTFDKDVVSEHSSLIVDINGIDVRGKTITETFKMQTESGFGKILASDEEGNGTWQEATQFHDDDWIPIAEHEDGSPMNLYLGPRYQKVGLGTTEPMQMLHLRGGNILISRNPEEAPGSLNGSIFFGEVVTRDFPNGEWGIEYYNEGLNFWKVASATNPGANYCLFLKNDGTVGIGTSVTHNYKLAVAGNVICEEMKVKLVADWPDYVFNRQYKLQPLSSIEKFINENGHLPDVPTSEEVKNNGLSLGEMNALLLKKVEELTLHVIALEKEINKLKADRE